MPNPVITQALKHYTPNQLIHASQLYEAQLKEKIREPAYYQALSRMCRYGELCKLAKGVYHLPKNSKYGIVPPSEQEIISYFTENQCGTVAGYHLFNQLQLTTQVGKEIRIFSSVIEEQRKTVSRVHITRLPITYSENSVHILHALEVLQYYPYMEDINHAAFLRYTEKIAEGFSSEACEEVLSATQYKKSTLSFLCEILQHYHIKNELGKYLSPLSKYKHPTMEALYATARLSR